jgi:hypothetical protein
LASEEFEYLPSARKLSAAWKEDSNHVSYCRSSLCAGKAELFLTGIWYRGVADALSSTAHELLSGRRLQIVALDNPRTVGQRVFARQFSALDGQP